MGVSFSSCAPKKASTSSNTTLASRNPTVDDTQYKLAECNRIDSPGMALAGQISTYYSSGQLVPTYLNVNLTSIPPELTTSATQFMQIFRWAERINGQPTTNALPVVMYFVQKATGAVSNPNGSNKISKPAIDAIIAAKNLGALGITVANFFERHYVVLTGMDTTWDAARFVLYDGTTTLSSGSVLLPAFYANPNMYMKANSALSLQLLHPNYNYRTSNATESDYLSLTEQICSGFFGSYRAPASFGEPELDSASAHNNSAGTKSSSWFEMIREKFRATLSFLRLGKANL